MLVLAWAALLHAQTVQLAWDASQSSDVKGYRIYYGTNSRSYSYKVNAGLMRTQSVTLPWRGRWFFAATAYATNGVESPFSDEVQWENSPSRRCWRARMSCGFAR